MGRARRGGGDGRSEDDGPPFPLSVDGLSCGARVRAWVLWAPGAAEIGGWMVGEGEEKRSVGADDIDVRVVGRVVGEGEVAAVWGPGGVHVVNQVVGESDQACAVGVHKADLVISVAVGGEGDALAVR